MAGRFNKPFLVDDFATMDRRYLLKGLGTSPLVTSGATTFTGMVWAAPAFSAYPFSLGVASGDPAPDGFVIWTKIAPRPLDPDGGLPNKIVEVEWAVAADAGMRQVVRSGKANAHPELGHAVHVEIGELEPAHEYFYRFTVGGEQSRIGRAKTLPAAGASVAEVRFAAAGCQRYEEGYFTAFRHLAEERLDFVFHYGDYIYEYETVRPGDKRPIPVIRVMPGEPDETYTLTDYRHRYALHKLDPDLQEAHASAPFVMTFDDHEVDNNWTGDAGFDKAPPELFLLRRAAAFQAWYEHMPVRRALVPRGPDILAYRRFSVGNLVGIDVLDTRQYRSRQPCGGRIEANCKEAFEPQRTMLGETQERWLYDGFRGERARWSVLAQQVMMMRSDFNPDPNVFAANLDKWEWAVAARDRLFAAIEDAKLRNLVVITGDIHSNWAGELKKNFDDPRSAPLGVEFIATSITSGGDGFDTNETYRTLLSQQRHLKFYNSQRGYVRHVVTPERWRADYQVVDKITVPDGRLSTRRSFIVENGRSGLSDA